jgi:hypothetical protein
MCIGWVAVALVVVAFWAVAIAATLALFPAAPPHRRRRSGADHD